MIMHDHATFESVCDNIIIIKFWLANATISHKELLLQYTV